MSIHHYYFPPTPFPPFLSLAATDFVKEFIAHTRTHAAKYKRHNLAPLLLCSLVTRETWLADILQLVTFSPLVGYSLFIPYHATHTLSLSVCCRMKNSVNFFYNRSCSFLEIYYKNKTTKNVSCILKPIGSTCSGSIKCAMLHVVTFVRPRILPFCSANRQAMKMMRMKSSTIYPHLFIYFPAIHFPFFPFPNF